MHNPAAPSSARRQVALSFPINERGWTAAMMLLRKLNRRDAAPLFVSYVFSGASTDVFTRSTYGGTISDLARRGHRERLRGEMGHLVAPPGAAPRNDRS